MDGERFEDGSAVRAEREWGVARGLGRGDAVREELPEILGLSDRILVMSEGRIVAELDHTEANEEKIIDYATMGKSKAA